MAATNVASAAASSLRRQARQLQAQASRLLATADRLDAAAAGGSTTGGGSSPPLRGSAARAAAVIRATPRLTGDEVAAAIGVEPVTFRTHVVPKLKAHGFTNRGWGGGGYYPPPDAARGV